MKQAKDLRAAWSRGETTFGVWAALPCAFGAELVAIPGISYVCVDQQHGVIDYSEMVSMSRGIEGRGSVPITRVPANDTWLISKALDAGLQGVVVPLVNNRAEAEKAVAACRYPPKGIRSYGPTRAAVVMEARDIETVGDTVVCFAMVETREALERIDEIASTPGLDGIYIGPADLALGLGLAPDLDKTEPEHAAAVERILRACQRNKIIAGIQCGTGASGRKYADLGFQLVTITKDSSLLQAGVKRELDDALADKGMPVKRVAQGYT
jgi:4-hydroxy-2-oxoheptanedioate aldolase